MRRVVDIKVIETVERKGRVIITFAHNRHCYADLTEKELQSLSTRLSKLAYALRGKREIVKVVKRRDFEIAEIKPVRKLLAC